jgi:hypothetical protein
MSDEKSDPRGERGGDTGNTQQKGKGKTAEKGDQRRDKPTHKGPTRPGGSSRGKSGSDSNSESDR